MTGTVRIIGGRWRRRRVRFSASSGVRPTPDRVRETLFNWLAPDLEGARCLDLFAGSGVLGFEAASRGASRVVMVERDRRSVVALERQKAELESGAVEVVNADASAWLRRDPDPFDIVFIDPPYAAPLHDSICESLEAGGWLNPGARVYLESHRDADRPVLPAAWTLLHEKRAGQVRYYLARRAGS